MKRPTLGLGVLLASVLLAAPAVLAAPESPQDRPTKKETQKGDRSASRIVLVDVREGDKPPRLAVYALDRSGKVLHTAEVDGGNFKLPDKVLAAADRVAIAPLAESFAEIDRDTLAVYRAREFARILESRADLPIARNDWLEWIPFYRCMRGSVRHCYPHWWVVNDLIARAAVPELAIGARAPNRRLERSPVTRLDRALLAERIARPHALPFRCDTVCDGLVEVYRRRCCCPPLVIGDPRIPEIIIDLERRLPDPPIVRWPPRPQPDPPPWSELDFLEGGAINEGQLHAQRDLQALRRLDGAALLEYVRVRPYLFCSCGPASKVAQGFIRPDGDFSICWRDFPRIRPRWCHDEYAFVVKQVIGGTTVTIYDGLAANRWYHAGDDADLVSYHPGAIGCRENEFEGTGAFVLLQDLGDTESHHLKTPDATGWDRVAVPVYNDGLVFPAASPAAALGQMRDRNWGGTVLLRYHFSEAMKGIGAHYYRLSVAAANGVGNPTGARTYLTDGVTWRKYVVDGVNINVETENLGPATVGGEPNLFKIPYDADASWQSGQYHAALATTRPEFTHGRYLLTVETFNASGQKLKPTGAPAADPGTAAAFTYRRWFQPVGPTAAVPYGALTHMLWWDNRHARVQIVDLRVGGTPNMEECQFLESPASALFSSGYRAYHPEPMFQRYHYMWWRRGLGGPSDYLTVPTFNPSNVGMPPAAPGVSGTASFEDMLGPHAACSFSLNLRIRVKTFDGRVTLTGLDDSDQAAFALSISGVPVSPVGP